ncbi:MAG: D-erythronate dehydrogenase [Pseudomonadota bacterium]
MHVVVTGAAGFLGQKIIKALADRGTIGDTDGAQQPITGFKLIDVVAPKFAPSGAKVLIGDLSSPNFIAEAVLAEATHVFHLAAVVSGQAEADFELGMRVNIDATRALLENLHRGGQVPRLVYPSSIAVFGHAPDIIGDETATLPNSSYGAQKAMSELLINDMSRRGFIDGVSVRVPTVMVRPGKPNAAASSFASSIIREPLAGRAAVCPVSTDLAMWVSSPQTVCANLIHAADLASGALDFPRMINLPGLSVEVAEMISAAERAGIDTSFISFSSDPAIDAIVRTWPQHLDTVRVKRLGFVVDQDIDAIIREHQQHRLAHG